MHYFQTYLIKQSAFGGQGSVWNVSSSLAGRGTCWINGCGVCEGATIYQLQPLGLSVLQVQGQKAKLEAARLENKADKEEGRQFPPGSRAVQA